MRVIEEMWIRSSLTIEGSLLISTVAKQGTSIISSSAVFSRITVGPDCLCHFVLHLRRRKNQNTAESSGNDSNFSVLAQYWITLLLRAKQTCLLRSLSGVLKVRVAASSFNLLAVPRSTRTTPKETDKCSSLCVHCNLEPPPSSSPCYHRYNGSNYSALRHHTQQRLGRRSSQQHGPVESPESRFRL